MKRLYHVTTATHDSRTSPRMIEHEVRKKRHGGTRPYARPIHLNEEDEMVITKAIAEVVIRDKIEIIAFNICKDHMHILIRCERKDLNKTIGKLKAISSRKYNIYKGKTIPANKEIHPTNNGTCHTNDNNGICHTNDNNGTCPIDVTQAKQVSTTHASTTENTPPEGTMGHIPPEGTMGHIPPEGTMGHVPLTSTSGASTRKKYNSLWTQKFGCNPIRSDQQLWNTIRYIRNNRVKHKLPTTNKQNPNEKYPLYVVIESMCTRL